MKNDTNHHYQSHLLEQFSHIYSEYADLSPNNQLLPDVANRQQILFMQYEMEKRGKNLGMAQTRLFKIEEGHLFQVTDSSQQKPLPFPIEIIMIRRNNQQWQSKYEQFKAKIILKFTERSDITVFFREIIEWRQVGMFLQATIRHQKGKNFTRLAQNFTVRMAEKVADKIKAMKDACTNLQNLRVKAKLNQLLKDNLSDRSMMNAFLKEWKSKVHFQRRNVAALTLKFLSMKSLIQEKGTLILWVQGSATKKVNFLPASINKEKTSIFQFVFGQQNSYQFLNISSDAEIQIEAEINNTVFKTQRFLLNDLEKAASRCKFFEMNLLHKGQIIYLKMSLESSTVSTYNKTIEISPRHYRVIDQLYLNSQSHFQLANIHEFYSQSLLKHRQLCGLSLSFTRVRTLCDMLGVQQLINKFFIVSPFKDYINIDNKGSAVYEYFIRNYQKEHFYDVEKLAWKIKDLTCKRVLFALKSFDENPKFNFTQPFLYLVQKIYDCAFTETINRWRINLFYKTIQGVQALAFFLSLAVVKSFSSLFIHQELVNKRALPYNSLLFTYVLRKYRPELNNKYDRLQLNIQAYFGHHFVSLFSCLLHDDLFACVLLKIVNDHQKQGQNLYIQGLIALFFTIMDRIDSFKCAYLTAQHYILTFQEYCFNIEDKHALFTQMQKWQKTITEQSVSVEFNQLVTELTDFYLANSYLGDLGEISRQIYQQFICYHYKNQMDLRKILLFIDKIQVGETCNQLNLTIFQSATKIYEHNFKGVDFAKLEHFVQLRLLKLQELNIICNNGKISLSCRADPKELPSNLYFHMVKPLTLTYHMSPECNRNIFLQVYIKDNTQIDSLQNPLPKKYCEQYFEKGLSKEDLLFCKKFSKSFRMRENNFNLLYTKLGWFGNHYLIPEDRLLDIHTISLRQHQPNTNRIYALDRYTRVVYGKTILPRSLIQQDHVCVQLIKQGVLTTYQRPIISSNSNDVNHYSVANRLLCYCLDNFSIHSSMQFLQFYYKINQQLPLISYLSYKPKLFYDLPSFTFQVFNTVSTATVLISHKGSQFLIDLSPAEIAEIEDRASWVSKLPNQFQFGYTNKKMQFDEYLYWLRLNILKKVGQLGEKKAKSRRWPNSLVSTTVNIPNYQLHNFYEVMNETKQIIQFEYKEIHKLCQPLCYSQFALIQNRWKDVHCIAQLNTSTGIYYYVIEKIQRKKYIVQDSKLIKTSPRQIKLVQLSDDIANSMEVVTYQLNKMFNL